MQKRILIGISKEDDMYGATALDYPGCVAVGKSVEEVKQRMQEALATHIEGMLEDGEDIPDDVTQFAIIDVSVNVPAKV